MLAAAPAGAAFRAARAGSPNLGGDMNRILGQYSEQAYAVMRIVVGLLFTCHGLQKILGLFGGVDQAGGTASFGLIWVAGLIELVGGLCIATGFQAAIAAFICSGQMAVAYFMAHQGRAFVPLQNGGGLAVFYCFGFLYIATRGSGIWSLGSGARA